MQMNRKKAGITPPFDPEKYLGSTCPLADERHRNTNQFVAVWPPIIKAFSVIGFALPRWRGLVTHISSVTFPNLFSS